MRSPELLREIKHVIEQRSPIGVTMVLLKFYLGGLKPDRVILESAIALLLAMGEVSMAGTTIAQGTFRLGPRA